MDNYKLAFEKFQVSMYHAQRMKPKDRVNFLNECQQKIEHERSLAMEEISENFIKT